MGVSNNYNLYKFESKSDLGKYTKINRIIILNKNCVDQKRFYGISVDTVESIFIGIIGEQHGIEPSLQVVERENYILISIDEKVYYVEL